MQSKNSVRLFSEKRDLIISKNWDFWRRGKINTLCLEYKLRLTDEDLRYIKRCAALFSFLINKSECSSSSYFDQ
uniref:Ribosomal protein S14 n=1 Tax=Romanomermis culicivorax TaxID=13658 RepID=A0A915IYM2_ROMCU